jgi:hypothetical protein
VYCLEEQDNGADLHLLSVDAGAPVTEKKMDICGAEVTALQVPGYRKIKVADGSAVAPQTVHSEFSQTSEPASAASTTLYQAYTPASYENVTLTYIPYYTWANRGENEMQVWTKLRD